MAGRKTTMADDILERRRDFGRRLLGPVVADYLHSLYAHARFFEEVRDARTLFVSRAGVRIRRALEVFVETAALPPLKDAEYFWISRLMVAKGTWRLNRENALQTLQDEFAHATLREMVEAMLRPEGIPEEVDLNDEGLAAQARDIGAFLDAGGPAARAVLDHFEEQGALFEAYLNDLLGDRSTVLLVDTGWAGTAQRLLADAYPEKEWWGAYFGRYGFERTNRKYWRNMIGLVFEEDSFTIDRPETCVVLHRHMIEHLFEPKGPSIERLARNGKGGISAPEADAVLADAPDARSDPMFTGVLEHLAELPNGAAPAALRAAARKAWQEIARIVTLPTREEAELFAHIERSADFGKTIMVPLLLEPKDRFEGDSPARRIADSLWQPGQAAREYPRELADSVQRRIAGLKTFDFRKPWAPPKVSVKRRGRPAVAVITRTLDRPMFLARALRSVAAQTFDDYVHVVVSDGGDIDLARRTIEETDCRHERILLIDTVENRGMEAASNIGIRAVDSDYIVIHDDDDTWEKEFLARTVEFLDGPKGEIYGGVITKSRYVSEEVTPKGIVIHGRAPYQGWVENVHIMEMAIQNFFPPIAFLFKREIYDRIGGFNEDYPVLGDWDFNLRFLMEADIGVIDAYLANYHHRDKGDTSLFGNTVIAGRDKHLEYSAVVRNRFARNMLHRDHPALAVLVGLGLHLDDIRQGARRLQQQTEAVSKQVTEIVNPLKERADRSPSERGLFDADDYWVAMTRLERAVVLGDKAVLRRLGMKPLDKWRKMLNPFRKDKFAEGMPKGLTEEAIRYLCQLSRKGYELEPPPDFDEESYLLRNPDVAAAVARGDLSCGFEHYYLYGRKEGRKR